MSAAMYTSCRQRSTHTRTSPLGLEIIKLGEPYSRLSTCPLKRGACESARMCSVSDGTAARAADTYAAARIIPQGASYRVAETVEAAPRA